MRVPDRILVDTDVFSYIFRNDTRAQFFRPHLEHKTLAISFMTVAELYYGAYKSNWGSRRIAQLENVLRNYVVIPYDMEVTKLWAEIRQNCERQGTTINIADCWIAACAVRHNLALATNNGADYECVRNILLISPGFV